MSNILIACEESQVVTNEFRKLGHKAWSCDILPTSGEHPEWHVQGDVRQMFGPDWEWDAIIAFPPCTHLSSSGARWWKEKRADGRQQEAVEFFMMFVDSAKYWAIENPIGYMSTAYRKPDQIIQPWQFGHRESKSTCLWLGNLPPLKPTNVLTIPDGTFWDNQTPSGQNKLGPSPERAMLRSKTYLGIAEAMAWQWSMVIGENNE